MRIRTERWTVNRCQDRDIYVLAEQNKIALFYTPNPVQPSPDIGRAAFATLKKFPVPANKALALFEKIKAGMPPETIIKDLNLKEDHQEEERIVRVVQAHLIAEWKENERARRVAEAVDRESSGRVVRISCFGRDSYTPFDPY